MATCNLERSELMKAARDAQEAREKKMASLDSAMKRDMIISKVQANGGIKNAAETIHAMLRGTYKNIKEAANSVQSKWLSKREQYATLFNFEVQKANLTKAFNSGLMDKEVYGIMYDLQNGKKVPNSPAATLAKIIIQFTDKARDDVNAVGGRIKDARDYAISTSHDSDKLRAAAGPNKTIDQAYNAWWKDVKNWISPKTFIGDIARDGESVADMQNRIGRSIYDSLYTGVYEKIGSTETGFVSKDFENTSNVSNNVSAHRAIIWKDGESAYSYSQKYGKNPNLASTVSSIFDRMARAGAVMEKFGNNPMANLNMTMRRLEETYKGSGDDLKAFKNQKENLRNEMAQLDGTANIPANMGFISKAGPVVRALENTMHLGGVMWTHFFSGVYSIPGMAAHRGINRLETFSNMASSIFKGLPEGEGAKIAAENGAFGDGMFRRQSSIFGQDTIPGRVSAFANAHMNATGIHFLFDRWKAGIKDMLSQNLASNIGNKFEDLEPHVQNMMSRYGINKDEWGLIQQSEGTLREFNGRKYLTPTSVKEGISDSSVEGHLRSNDKIRDTLTEDLNTKQAARDDIAQKLQDAQRAAAEPDAAKSTKASVKKYTDQLAQAETSLKGHQDLVDARAGKIEKTPDMDQSLQRYDAYDNSLKQKAIGDFKDSLSDKILSYYSDAAREGVVTPGVKEQAFMYGGTKAGTGWSEIKKFLWQFKSWPLAAWNQIVERDIHLSLSKKEVAYNLGTLMAIGVPSGYARMSMNAAMSGKSLPDPTKLKTLLEATGSSGALGILGDSLFGQINRMEKEGLYTLAGPTIADASKVTEIFAKAMGNAEGEKNKLWPDLAQFAVSHVPFANLFYVKGAYDYLLAYHLLEAANPGWWERTNQRLMKDKQQPMSGYTPGGGVPWGVPGVYLANKAKATGLLAGGQ